MERPMNPTMAFRTQNDKIVFVVVYLVSNEIARPINVVDMEIILPPAHATGIPKPLKNFSPKLAESINFRVRHIPAFTRTIFRAILFNSFLLAVGTFWGLLHKGLFCRRPIGCSKALGFPALDFYVPIRGVWTLKNSHCFTLSNCFNIKSLSQIALNRNSVFTG
ncbi:MAG: hypothetical protein WC914_06145 [Proteiniphilum sp.]